MIIVNADDWGRSVAETDAALACHRRGRITSVTAMSFMADSERARDLALGHGISAGLHLNVSQPFSAATAPAALVSRQQRVCAFINAHKYAFLLYNPALRNDFVYTYEAQCEEFARLYGKAPSHIDGHHHKHLCSNLLLDRVIPKGKKVRRSFFFWPGEKGMVNRSYRRLIDHVLARRYRVTDYFFALSQCLQRDRLERVLALAKTSTVELMAHPANPREATCLMSDDYAAQLAGLDRGTYHSV
jgi:chitin disaccharide deacetylase